MRWVFLLLLISIYMIIIGLLQIFLVYSLGYAVRPFVVLIKYCFFMFIHFNPYSASFSFHALLACFVLGLVHRQVTTTGHSLFSLKSTQASLCEIVTMLLSSLNIGWNPAGADGKTQGTVALWTKNVHIPALKFRRRQCGWILGWRWKGKKIRLI